MQRVMVMVQPGRYEQVGRKAGLRMPSAAAGRRSLEQPAFLGGKGSGPLESVAPQPWGVHACMQRAMVMVQPGRYEQVGRKAGLRMPSAAAGRRSLEQPAFLGGKGSGPLESVAPQPWGVHACMQRAMVMVQPSRYGQVSRKAGLRMPSAAAGSSRLS